MKGTRLLQESVIPGDWMGTLSGSAQGVLQSLEIIPYQDEAEIYPHVFEFSGSGTITGIGPIDSKGYFYHTSTTTSPSGTNLYGFYEMAGALNETGILTGRLNPSTGKISFTMTSDDGKKHRLSGERKNNLPQ